MIRGKICIFYFGQVEGGPKVPWKHTQTWPLTSALLISSFKKTRVLLTKISSYETLNTFLQNDHISNFGNMYPGESCLP